MNGSPVSSTWPAAPAPGRDVQAVPALGDAVAGGGDRAVLVVGEVDAGHLGVQRERGLVDEREQDLLQVQAGVERAGGAHDGAVLGGAGGAARVGLQARVARGGLVGQQLGGLDRLRRRARGGRSSAIIRTWRISFSHPIGTNRTEAMPCFSARPCDDLARSPARPRPRTRRRS